MKISKLAATAAMAISAVAIAAGTAHAEPAGMTAPAVHGIDHGMGYQVGLTNAGKSITTTLDAGFFKVTGDASAVALTDAAGNVVERLPLVAQVRGEQVALTPRIDASGHSLTLTPATAPTAAAQDINGQQWFMDELQHAAPGALVGAIIGGILGFFFFFAGAIPGAIIGAIAGALIAGGQPLIDSGVRVFQRTVTIN